MDLLLIDNKPLKTIRFFIGVLLILAGIANFLSIQGIYRFIDFLMLGFFVIAGIGNMTNHFWTSKTFFQISSNGIMIKLPNKLKSINLETTNIDLITLQKSQIIVNLKTRGPIKINLNSFELSQKRQIHNFIIEYSKEKNIPLKRLLTAHSDLINK